MDGQGIPNLKDAVPHVFLRKPVGSFLPKDTAKLEDILDFAREILSSWLAPWQRIFFLLSNSP